MSLTRLVATYRLTTPMFCAGADPNAAAELRPASFKGILRFWYRALALAEYDGDVNRVREEEADLFGSTGAGQARVLLSIRKDNGERPLAKYSKFDLGLAYLAGQGLTKYTREEQAYLTQRPAIDAGLQFQVDCLFRPSTQDFKKDIETVRKALVAVGLLGGLGSRSRRGFGSLTLEKLERIEDKKVTQTWQIEDVQQGLKSLFPAKPIDSTKCAYTAFSSDARFLVLPSQERETPVQLLGRMGKAFVHYRSYGRNGKIAPNIEAKQWFREDHDLMREIAQSHGHSRRDLEAPARAVFGLPHNYYFSSLSKRDGTLEVHGEKNDRRASPLFFHIHHVPNQAPVGIVAFLPAVFLPHMQLDVKQDHAVIAKPKLAEPPDLWEPIRSFLYELALGHHSRLTATFPGAKEVKWEK